MATWRNPDTGQDFTYGNENSFNPAWGQAGGLAGTGLAAFLSKWKNPADEAEPYLNQIPGQLQKSLGPYIDAGQRALPNLETQFNRNTTNPGGALSEIGAGYQKSPGFDFAMKQALQASQHAAAATGMSGSPQHEQQSMELATNLANQDSNQWIQHALEMYRLGLTGEENLYNTGAATGVGMGQDLASLLASLAKLHYEGANAENEREGGTWGSIGGGLGTIAGNYLGGPIGGAVGGGIGNSISSFFD